MQPRSVHPPTALVIDDEDSLCRLVARILERSGYRALTAADGEAGLARFREHVDEIRLVMLDVVLPTLRAEQLLPEMRAARPDLAVILMSGDAPPSSLEAELAASQCRFLRKPFGPRTLHRILGELAGDGEEDGSERPAAPGRHPRPTSSAQDGLG